MNVLVTGDEGKLGSRVKALLGARGYDLKRGEDILDLGRLKDAMRGCEVVVHCAGIPHPTDDPLWVFMRANVIGTSNVCLAAVEVGVKRVVYFSSTAWYGCNAEHGFGPMYLPVHEGHPPRPLGKRSAYGESKRMAESILAWYGTNRLVETVALRCAPANPKSGQYPDGFDWRECGDYRRKSLWANCHPDYAARAAQLAATHPDPLWYEVFNLSDAYVTKKVNLDLFVHQLTGERGEPGQHSLFDIRAAIVTLGWEPCQDR